MAGSVKGPLKKADSSTIQDKFLVGYQGCFTCKGDGPPVHPGHHGWLHWFDKPIPEGGHANMDIWPDLSAYSPSELFPVPGLSLKMGQPACLFSSRHPRTVQRHFHWMAEHSIDGCFLLRSANQIEADGLQGLGVKADLMRLTDEIGNRVREAAEQEGRVFAIMYDISGVPAHDLPKILEVDWSHLIRDCAFLDSSSYLREHGKPVLALRGVGFVENRHTPTVIAQIVRTIRHMTPGGAYIIAGTPAHWQTLTGDADPNPAFLDLYYNEFDAISPWTVGSYLDLDGADQFAAQNIKNDIQAIERNSKGRKIDYIPVVWPGGSVNNMSGRHREPNSAPRDGGKLLWRQIFNAKHHGARTLYGATWDGYDDGTAFMPVSSYKSSLPLEGRFIALDVDGYDLPSDWYMRICGMAAEVLRSERRIFDTFPRKELDDYWSLRPEYDTSSVKASGSGSGSISEYHPLQNVGQVEEKEEEAPPPYTLESSEPSTASPSPLGSTVRGAARSAPAVPLLTRPSDSQQGTSSGTQERPTQDGFVGGFCQGRSRSPQLLGQASLSLIEEFRHHTLTDNESHATPTTHPSRPPAVPTHTRPDIQSHPNSSLGARNWSHVQFPPPEWNLPKVEMQPHPRDLGYPAPHANYASLHRHSPPPIPQGRPSNSSDHIPPLFGNIGTDSQRPHSDNQSYLSTTDHGQHYQSHFGQSSSQQPQYSYTHEPYAPHSQSSLCIFPQQYQHDASLQPQFSHSSHPQPHPSQAYSYNSASQQPQNSGSTSQYSTHSHSPSASTHLSSEFSAHSEHTSYSPSPPPHHLTPTFPSRPVAGTSAGIPIPWGMVDKVAGKERRKKLEQGVDSVLQTGTKLLNQYKTPFGK